MLCCRLIIKLFQLSRVEAGAEIGNTTFSKGHFVGGQIKSSLNIIEDHKGHENVK